MKKILFTATVLLLLIAPANAQLNWHSFDSKGHPKAKGLWVSVQYPQNYKPSEGRRPNIVQKFLPYNRIDDIQSDTIFMLLIKELPADFLSYMSDSNTWSDKKWMDFAQNEYLNPLPDGSTIYSIKKITHEGQPGFLYDMSMLTERAGSQPIHQKSRGLDIFYKNKLVSLQCFFGTDSIPHKPSSTTICDLFFNSLILMDRY